MKPLRPNLWLIFAFTGGIVYPLLVYYGMNIISPKFLVFAGLALIGIRLLGLRSKPETKIIQIAFFIAAFALIALLFLNAELAVKAYPVAVSLSVSAIFAASLFFPPTVVERIARLAEPNLPPEGVVYTRKVTIIWVIFLLMNALISIATALWGTLAQWALWNGLLSYFLMGMLFLGEMGIRRMIRR